MDPATGSTSPSWRDNDEAITNLGTAMIGDRVQIRSGTIEDGTITLDIVRAGPEDAACCPTEKALVTWALSEDGLSQIADETIGTLSLADLGGHEWVLIELGSGSATARKCRDQPRFSG